MCFATVMCGNSLRLNEWEVDTMSECLEKCKETDGCEYFNFYADGDKHVCDGLANCAVYYPDSCSFCNVGRKTCNGEIIMLL